MSGLVHDVDHGRKVVRVLVVVGGDEGIDGGVVGGETDFSSASGSVQIAEAEGAEDARGSDNDLGIRASVDSVAGTEEEVGTGLD